MKNNVVKNKSFDFAIRIVKLSQYLSNEKKEFTLSKQLLRSGTSIGAMVEKLNMLKAKTILFINLQSHKKRQMSLLTGWNYCTQLII